MKQLIYAFIACATIQSMTQAMEPVQGEGSKGQAEFVRPRKQRSIIKGHEDDDGVAQPRGVCNCCMDSTSVEEAPTTRKPLTDRDRKLIDREMRAADTEELLYAVLHQQPKKVLYALLKDSYADVNYKDGIGWAPIHYAARDRSVEVLRVLLAVKGIDTKALDGLGRTVQQVIASRRDCATEEHQALCDDMSALLDAHSVGYPFEIQGNKLIVALTKEIILSANPNENP